MVLHIPARQTRAHCHAHQGPQGKNRSVGRAPARQQDKQQAPTGKIESGGSTGVAPDWARPPVRLPLPPRLGPPKRGKQSEAGCGRPPGRPSPREGSWYRSETRSSRRRRRGVGAGPPSDRHQELSRDSASPRAAAPGHPPAPPEGRTAAGACRGPRAKTLGPCGGLPPPTRWGAAAPHPTRWGAAAPPRVGGCRPPPVGGLPPPTRPVGGLPPPTRWGAADPVR